MMRKLMLYCYLLQTYTFNKRAKRLLRKVKDFNQQIINEHTKSTLVNF